MYADGACRILYRHAQGMSQLPIVHIEVTRSYAPSGYSTCVLARMLDNRVIADKLFSAAQRANAAPFFESAETVAALRHTLSAESLGCIVKFAPEPGAHPQYLFKSVQDGWEFMQHVAERTLLCSANVHSIKSACTHGNSVEAGTETIQIWEDTPVDGDAIGKARTRTVKFFRNKNPHSGNQVVEFDCNTLRPPDVDARSGKVTFRFRDVREGVVKEMKYLKIAFLSEEDRIDFLHEVGFPEHIPALDKS
jgi:hypothetical protein